MDIQILKQEIENIQRTLAIAPSKHLQSYLKDLKGQLKELSKNT